MNDKNTDFQDMKQSYPNCRVGEVSNRISEVYCMDCNIGMKSYPDKYFDLAVVDPPYGIGLHVYPNGITRVKKKPYKSSNMSTVAWDYDKPTVEYINELFRISKNQIIFGANHFIESINKNSSCWIVFDKVNGDSKFSDAELAWTSFEKGVRIKSIQWFGANSHREGKRIHPTQKPIALYDWIFKKFLPEGGLVIDTHLGSGSSRIAAKKAQNIDFIGYENDEKYYKAQQNRYSIFCCQKTLF